MLQTRLAKVARLLATILLIVFVLTSCQTNEFTSSIKSQSVDVDNSDKSNIRGSLKIARFESFRDQVYFDKTYKSAPSMVEDQKQAVISDPVQVELYPADLLPDVENRAVVRDIINIEYCKKIDKKLSSVSFRDCLLMKLQDSEYVTVTGKPIHYVEFASNPGQTPIGKILVLGGVHGDELTSVSTVYRWIKTLKRFHSGLFDWRVVPIVNPDGFFRSVPSRTNGNGVDLNRNLPTYQWNQLAKRYWKNYAGSNDRKFPGNEPASEPETQWLVNEMKTYQPDVIITVHAPYNLVDFDSADRSNAPRRLGILRGKSLGTFPGSLGRYAGEERNIPVITLELPHSSTMPPVAATNAIWLDMVEWLRDNVNPQNLAGGFYSHCHRSLEAVGCI